MDATTTTTCDDVYTKNVTTLEHVTYKTLYWYYPFEHRGAMF